MRNVLRRLFGGTSKKQPDLSPHEIELTPNEPEEKERRPLMFPYFWKKGGNRCFITTPKQGQMLVINLPQNHITSLQMHSFFTEKVPDVMQDAYVDFGIFEEGYIAPYIQIRMNGVAPIHLNFCVPYRNDPISALVVLYVMYKQCPLAFLLTPCNYGSYCEKIFSQEELGHIEYLRGISYYDVYNDVKNHFIKKGGDILADVDTAR